LKEKSGKRSALVNPLGKAKAYAFLLLKFRLRSEKELAMRLRRKKFPENIIARVIGSLKDKNFLDDRVFAQAWVKSRINSSYGPVRIREELRLKGLDDQAIEDSLNQIKTGYTEKEAAIRLAKQKLAKQNPLKPQKAKARVYAYLMRRGFNPEIINEVVKES